MSASHVCQVGTWVRFAVFVGWRRLARFGALWHVGRGRGSHPGPLPRPLRWRARGACGRPREREWGVARAWGLHLRGRRCAPVSIFREGCAFRRGFRGVFRGFGGGARRVTGAHRKCRGAWCGRGLGAVYALKAEARQKGLAGVRGPGKCETTLGASSGFTCGSASGRSSSVGFRGWGRTRRGRRVG